MRTVVVGPRPPEIEALIERRAPAALLLAAALLIAGCTGSGDPEPSAAPAVLGAEVAPIEDPNGTAAYKGFTAGTPIQRKPVGRNRQVSLLGLATDGVALISTRKDVQPDSIDGIYLAAGELKLSYPARHVDPIPGKQRAVEEAVLTERHALWIERLGPVEDGFVAISGKTSPDWTLLSYDRTTEVITTLARIKGGNTAPIPEFSTPLVIGDRAVWIQSGPGKTGPVVFSRPLDGSAFARKEVAVATATATDGVRLWYSTVDGNEARIVSRDLAAGSEVVAHEFKLGEGEELNALAAGTSTVAWSLASEARNRLVVSDGAEIQGEITTGPLAARSLHVGPKMIGYGESSAEGDGHVWLLDRDRNVRLDLGTSCCPQVLVGGSYVVWDDGKAYRRARLGA